MPKFPSAQAGWIIVGLLSIIFPLAVRVFYSPVLLFLFFPFLLLLLVIVYLSCNVLISYILDTLRSETAEPPPNLLRTAARPLAFSTPAAWQAVLTRSQWSSSTPQPLPHLYPESPLISNALDDIFSLIVRDFVLTWYFTLSPSPAFPTSVSVAIHASIQNIVTRLEGLDLPSLVVRRILPKITAHIEQFRQSEVALQGAGLERHLTQADELDLLLAGRYAGRGGKLHPAVDNLSSMVTKQTEEAHLRGLVERILPLILPPNEAGSRVVRIVAREIVTCVILGPVMDMLADPDFWNRTIDQLVCF